MLYVSAFSEHEILPESNDVFNKLHRLSIIKVYGSSFSALKKKTTVFQYVTTLSMLAVVGIGMPILGYVYHMFFGLSSCYVNPRPGGGGCLNTPREVFCE